MHLLLTTTQPDFTPVDFTWGWIAILSIAAITALLIVGSYMVGKQEPTIHPHRYLYGGLGLCIVYAVIVFGFLYHQDAVDSVNKGIKYWAEEEYDVTLQNSHVEEMTLGYTNHILYSENRPKGEEKFNITEIELDGKRIYIQLVENEKGFQLVEVTKQGEVIAPLESEEGSPRTQ